MARAKKPRARLVSIAGTGVLRGDEVRRLPGLSGQVGQKLADLALCQIARRYDVPTAVEAKTSRAERHVWHERKNYCVVCGVRRAGYQGGRTGSLQYTWPDGRITWTAGVCPGPSEE